MLKSELIAFHNSDHEKTKNKCYLTHQWYLEISKSINITIFKKTEQESKFHIIEPLRDN